MPPPAAAAAHAGHGLLYAADVRHSAVRLADEFGQGLPDRLVRRAAAARPAGKDKELGDLLQTIHMSLNLLFVAVIAGHIGAALKHHFIDKDDILTRMLPAKSRETDMKRLAIALACVLPGAAQAVEYTQVQAEKSAIAFTYKQMGVAVDGRFSAFPASSVSTRPGRPRPGQPSMSNWPASTPALRKATRKWPARAWFNTRAFPSARFVSTGVKALGGNRYEVSRPAQHQGQDAGGRRPRHVHGAGQQRRLRRQLHHPSR
jgi:hypothetical protein